MAVNYHFPDGKVEKIVDLPFYTEGPAVDPKGNIFFTTLTGGTIHQLDNNGVLKQWGSSLCPNGQVVCKNGDHVICDSGLGAVRRYDAAGNFKEDIIFKTCCNKHVTSPNDLVQDRDGGFYFTNSVRENGRVFYCKQDGSQFLVAEKLDYPNGLVLSADEKCLFIAESYANRILKINLAGAGIARGEPELFANLPQQEKKGDNLPDGLAMDENGNLFVAHYGMQAIQVLSPQGRLLFSLDTGLPLTSNLFFSDARTLIVTGGYQEPGPGAVLRIRF